jgi:Condensation domain
MMAGGDEPTQASDAADSKRRIAMLSPTKRALLERWTDGEKVRRDGNRVVRPRPPGEAMRLSPGQQRLWLLDRKNMGCAEALLLYQVLEIRGVLNEYALQQAFDEIHRRHDCLRSRFVPRGEDVEVVIDPVPRSTLRVEDLTEVRSYASALSRAQREGIAPFDIVAGPVSRMVLYGLGPESHLLLLAIHHIVFDEWSMGVVLRELGFLYAAFCEGSGVRRPALPALPVQFQDFAYWQRRWLEEGEFETQRIYWAKQLAGDLPEIKLPGHTGMTSQARRGYLPVRFRGGLSGRVSVFAKENNVSTYMVLLTAVSLSLRALTGADEIIVGTPAANRNYGNVQELVGFFANNLPMRIWVGAHTSFSSLLKHVRQVSSEAMANQELPVSVIASFRADAATAGKNLYQIIFSLQNAPLPSLHLPNLHVEARVLDYGLTSVDLSFYLIDAAVLTNSTELAGMIQYNAAVYDESAIASLWQHFVSTLEMAVVA